MPTPSPIRKLLKEHQAKYAALTEAESRGIMEEILSMKIGISADASVEDNEEAEQMIRAITHGDIDNSVSYLRRRRIGISLGLVRSATIYVSLSL